MVRSFELSSKIETVPDFAFEQDGTARDPELAIAYHIQWNLCQVFKGLFAMEHEDLWHYVTDFAKVGKGADFFRIDLLYPDALKRDIPTMMPIYDTMDRFVRRFMNEVVCPDLLYVQKDHACSPAIQIFHTPLAMISALDTLVHKKYRGNQECLAHLHMARHLLDRLDGYKPVLALH